MRKQGFTLIELLLVVAIAAIIAGALIPLFNVSRQDAQVAKIRVDLDAIKTASIMLNHDSSTWPPDGTAGAGLVDSGGIPTWEGPYLSDFGPDPWGQPYNILTVGTALWACAYGTDGTFNNCDTTADIRALITPEK